MGLIELRKSDRRIFKEAAEANKAAMEASRANGTGDDWVYEFQYNYWNAVATAHEQGKKLIAIGAGFPTEIIYALDAVPFWLDLNGICISGFPDDCSNFIELAENYVPQTMCTIDRPNIGAMVSGMYEVPDCVFTVTGPCDSFRQLYAFAAKIYDIPIYWYDQPIERTDKTMHYVAEQYKDAIVQLEKITGNKLDMDRLRTCCRRTSEANAYIIALAELKKTKPCPIPSTLQVLIEYAPAVYGTQWFVDMVRKQYELAAANVAAGVGVIPGGEKYRLMICQNMIWDMLEVLEYLEKELGVVVVSGSFQGVEGMMIDETDMDSILYGLAARGFLQPMIANAGSYASDWIRQSVMIAKDWKIDGALYLGHVGCKHTWAAARILYDALMKQCGIKTLELDVDAIDRRYQNSEEVMATIKEFVDTLED